MNKTDRMLAIVLELQRRKVLRAEDLASVFETSARTIYRDIQALSEAGVPIAGAPGVGYSLMDGYFLPPVSFTAEEAVALLIGTEFVEQKFDAAYGAKARASRGKIEAILPEAVRGEAERVRATVRLLAVRESGHPGREKECLEVLRGAVLERRKIRFRYSKSIPGEDGGRESVRTAASYGLVLSYGAWILVAYCELRQSVRHFRLSRMDELIVLETPFELPPDFHLQKYTPQDDRRLRVRLVAEPGIARIVKESNNFYMEKAEDREDGLHVTLRVRQIEDILPWVLGWGANIAVLEPETLRSRVREEAEKMVKRY